MHQPNMTSAGVCPLVHFGVVRYVNNILDSRSSGVPLVIFFILFLKICTHRSAIPLDCKWYGAVVIWCIPKDFRKDSNS